MSDGRHDVVIIGAGTAGTSCALECFDIQLDTAVFETHEQILSKTIQLREPTPQELRRG